MAELVSTVYQRRLANELGEARQLEECNTDVIRLESFQHEGEGANLRITLCQTSALLMQANRFCIVNEHDVTFHFPRFFPAVPIEAYLKRAVFHPNVDPVNGFVCLWDRYSLGDTLIGAVSRVQQILTWKMLNLHAEHIMQPEAVKWYTGFRDSVCLPLSCRNLDFPEDLGGLEVYSFGPGSDRPRRLSRVI
jgi:hypothetical protein